MKLREYPQWVIEAEKLYDPYIVGCHLSDDAPKEAKEAFEKVKKFFWSL